MKARLLKIFDIEHDEVERVVLLLVMGFSMGMFMAAMSVASQSLFLNFFDEETELPIAFVVSGGFGLQKTFRISAQARFCADFHYSGRRPVEYSAPLRAGIGWPPFTTACRA